MNMKTIAQSALLPAALVAALLVGGCAQPAAAPAESPADASTANPAQPTATQTPGEVQYVLYVGTNDKDTNQPVYPPAECMEKAKEALINRFGGYTIQEAQGGWIGEDGTEYQEYTLVIYLSDTTEEDVHAAAEEFIELFHQSSILIQGYETTTEFYSGE